MVVQVTQDDPSRKDALVTITGISTSADDPFYDGLEFAFVVGVRPTLTGPAVSATVETFVLSTTVMTLRCCWCI